MLHLGIGEAIVAPLRAQAADFLQFHGLIAGAGVGRYGLGGRRGKGGEGEGGVPAGKGERGA